MIDKFNRVIIIGDEDWSNDIYIYNIINQLSDKAIVFLKEGTECAKIIRQQTLIKGLETIGYVSNWKMSDTANIECNNTLIKDCRADLILLFVENEESLNNYDYIKKMSIAYKIPIIICKNEEEKEKDLSLLLGVETIKYICGECGESSIRNIKDPFGKFCSDKCILRDHPDMYKFIKSSEKAHPDSETEKKSLTKNRSFQHIEETTEDNFKSKCRKAFTEDPQKLFINDEPIISDNPKLDKLNRILLLEAKRHAYRQKKEDFKREMRQSSRIKGTTSNTKVSSIKAKKTQLCKATTKKNNKPCSNNALPGKQYCGIPSHKAQE